MDFATAYSAYHHLANALLPNHCLLCQQKVTRSLPLCEACEEDLPWLDQGCRRCGLPLANATDLCGQCLRSTPSFDRCITAFHYATPINRLINGFKHRRHILTGKVLSSLLLSYLCKRMATHEWPDLLTPVPLHWQRQLTRGFNQSTFITAHLGRALRLPIVQTLRRTRPTPKQQQLSRKQRLNNLRASFDTCDIDVRDRHITLVDDVVTTQATAEALSRQLKKAGARRVDIWAIARTPLPNQY